MFSANLKNFGIICKGKSILGLPDIEKKFDACFIINQFEKELYHFEDIFKKKKLFIL